MKRVRTAVALLLAGSSFFSGGWASGRVRRDVTVDGVEVGGMPYAEAARTVREKIKSELAPFTVRTPAGDRTFELGFSDNVEELLRGAKRGETLTAEVTPAWADAEAELSALCASLSREAQDATLDFSPAGFRYTPEVAGVACDYFRLLGDADRALKEGRTEAILYLSEYLPAVTCERLRARTRPLGTFTTSFDEGNKSRANNIALAASRIAGTVIEPLGEFSFNRTVGKRTAENGFSEAPVISGGEYVQGVGGGVCQASTTLMNAALRAGMRITESHPHSLSVGYVPPSLDAMVSEYSDLRFTNPYSEPVYVQARAGGGKVTFTLYGLPDGKRYRTESKVLLRVDPPPEKIVEGTCDRVLRAAKQGVASESWLLVFRGDELLSRTLLRRDTYAVVQGVREKKRGEGAEEEPAEPQN